MKYDTLHVKTLLANEDYISQSPGAHVYGAHLSPSLFDTGAVTSKSAGVEVSTNATEQQ